MMTAIARQTIRYERKREAILDAAATLFNARGLGGTIIADVAQSVGLTTTSVTYYYRRKEDLAAACLLRAIEVMDALVTRAEVEADTAASRLTRFVELYFGLLADTAEGRAPEGINFWDLRALTGQQAAPAMAAFVALFRRLRELFRATSGPTFSRIEQNARAHLVFSAIIRAKGWAGRYETEDYPRAAARMADILINGIAATDRTWAPAMLELSTPRGTDAGEVSRAAFLKAATELVNEHGYRGASVDRISARLKVTKGSFYHHNDTKDDLVAACFGRTFDVIRMAHWKSMTVADDGWSRLCAACAALVRHQFSEDGPLLRLSALSVTAEAVRPGLLAEIGRLSEKTAGMIADGIADGSIRAVDATIAAELVNGMVNAAAELSKWSPAATNDTAADLFVKPLMFGVFSPPGQLWASA
jgi:AcrR family transcriptional regulator